MMITNMLSTKNLQEQKTYFNEKHTEGNDFPHDLIQSKVDCEIKTCKWFALFLGTKRVSHSNERAQLLENLTEVIRMEGFGKCSQT